MMDGENKMPREIWAWDDYDGDIDGHWCCRTNQSLKIPVSIIKKYHHEDVVREKDRRIAELEDAMSKLIDAESDYKKVHDIKGGGHPAAGRALDYMRKMSSKAEQALKKGNDNDD